MVIIISAPLLGFGAGWQIRERERERVGKKSVFDSFSRVTGNLIWVALCSFIWFIWFICSQLPGCSLSPFLSFAAGSGFWLSLLVSSVTGWFSRLVSWGPFLVLPRCRLVGSFSLPVSFEGG
ncbi:hypothetical protein EDB80DRAFT_735869 [Ilyonectria destructans]|nr:hypothetical protein EDB80DRAFT_735869 [Ilyonectria destructans]